MECPLCNVTLTMADRQGITIDYCPQCRGIWLDRGELEKLIELSVAQATSQPAQPAARVEERSEERPRRRERDRDDRDDDRRDDYRDDRRYKYKKQESWLSRLLDFD